MTGPDRLDPLAFCGCFVYLDGDIPAEMKLADWRSRRPGASGFDSSTAAGGGAGPDLAPDDRILLARMGAHGREAGAAPARGRKQ
jgi:hypothetical protein